MESWISMKDRKPENEDADDYGCVLVWHLYQGVMLTGWRNACNGVYHTHWMHTPPPPEGSREAMRDFEFNVFHAKFAEDTKK